MIKNIVAVVFVIVLLVELYFCSAGSNHRKKKKLKGWNPTTGKIKKIDRFMQEMSARVIIIFL